MSGQVIYQEPAYVATRQSTDIMVIEDQDIAQAIRFINEHYKKPIGVDDVASAVHFSRRHLCKKFMASVGHSVADEIKKNVSSTFADCCVKLTGLSIKLQPRLALRKLNTSQDTSEKRQV